MISRTSGMVSTISIHAPREGGDNLSNAISRKSARFQSTPPARGATFDHLNGSNRNADFNPRPPRGGRRLAQQECEAVEAISIHAPREGGDSKDAQFYL